MELSAEPKTILLASLYMPFYDSSKRQDCLAETNETFTMLEEILTDHPRHQIILGGDFNTKFNVNSPFEILWRDFLVNHDLVLCDQFVNNIYTYSYDSLNHRKWNNHFLVSSSPRFHRLARDSGYRRQSIGSLADFVSSFCQHFDSTSTH